MKISKLIFPIAGLFICSCISGQIRNYNDSIVLANDKVVRKLNISEGNFYTSSFKSLESGTDYAQSGSLEFSFAVDGEQLSGGKGNQLFLTRDVQIVTRDDGQTLRLLLQGIKGSKAENISLFLVYELYDNFPVVRKHLEIVNSRGKEIALTNLETETLNLLPGTNYLCDVYAQFGNYQTKIPYSGNFNDAAVLLHNPGNDLGLIIGNEAPGVMKKLDIYKNSHFVVSAGMNRIDEPFPFKKYLKPGDNFITPSVFIYLVKTPVWQDAFEGLFSDFVRAKLGIRLFMHNQPPFILYNTWRPFRSNINEKVIKETTSSLQGTGTDVLIIDEGWQDLWGDWNADSIKFPRGMKPVCDDIISKGMKPGMWFSFSTADVKSKIVREHPEWIIRDRSGNPECLHAWSDRWYTMSMSSPWYDHMLNIMKKYVRECRLAYVKLDLTVVTSAYELDYNHTGDFDAQGKGYRDRESSYYELYAKTMQFMDDLHEAFPDLYIDCTFETWGRYSLIDYALVQHAEYDWLTNFEENSPEGPLSIRLQCRQRAVGMPASAMLIGNQLMNDPNYRYTFFSLASATPILVGDVRNMKNEQRNFYKFWTGWFRDMENKYQISRYYQTSDVFDMPSFSNWDGCMRFNKEKGGGVLFVYRNNSEDSERTFRLPWVDAKANYRIYPPDHPEQAKQYDGATLHEKGIRIVIPKKNDAMVMGVERIVSK
jgi:alpha-galactosidase